MPLEDEKGFYDVLSETQINAVMEMCKPELRLPVLERALEILKGNKEKEQ